MSAVADAIPMLGSEVLDGRFDGFRAEIRELIEREVLPEYAEWEQAGGPSREFWRAAGAIGLMGIGIPEQYGGSGYGFEHSAVATEEINRAGLSIGGLRLHSDVCVPYFVKFTSEEQRRRWLPGLASGQALAALAMSEPGAGSDVKAIATTAERDGDSFVINGAKTFISNGRAADLVITAAKTDPKAGRKGLSLIVVEVPTAGFERGRKLHKLGQNAQDVSELFFDDVRVPVENLLGEENAGFGYLTANLAQERLSIAVNAASAASAALARGVARAGAEGAAPATQRTKFELAAVAADVAAGQALIDRAIAAKADGRLSAAEAAMVKLACTEIQERVTGRCLRLQGPGDFVHESALTRAFLDARVTRIYGGSSEIMKVIVAQALGL